MQKDFDIVTLGEALIDFTPCGKSEENRDLLEVNPGGGPANMLSMASKLGGKTAFVGKVGDDHYGRFLADVLEKSKIDTKGIVFDKTCFTTLAFVHLDEQGDRSFSFARKPGADVMIRQDEVDWDIICSGKIFHFSTLSLTDEPIRSTIRLAIEKARKADSIISFDPNIRPLLWESEAASKEQLLYGVAQCDILKISDNELELATGIENVEEAVDQLLFDFPNIKLIFATLGKNGCFYKQGDIRGRLPTFTNVKTIDTTGAGDSFMGCCLWRIAQIGQLELNKEQLEGIVTFANAAASLVTTRRGGIYSIPEKEEVLKLIEQGTV